jgi:hypothetical protein
MIVTMKRTSRAQLGPLQLTFKVSERADVLVGNNSLDTEIECPSCQNTMDVYSISELPYTAVTLQILSVYPMVTNRILV